MGEDFLTWGNFITWVVCSILIYLSLNFRLYMIFHHPGRKLKAKARQRRMERLASMAQPSAQYPEAEPAAREEPGLTEECLHHPCFAKGKDPSNSNQGNHLHPR